VVTATGAAAAAVDHSERTRSTPDDPLVSLFDNLARSTAWEHTSTLDLDFDTFHPQAMEVTEDRIYLSSVEVTEPPVKYQEPRDGYDRTSGAGVGHLFVLDREGHLLKDIELGEGDMYHPGGLDVDDEHIYVPVAEYRPDSRSIVYRVDLDSLEAEKLFTVEDHVGGVIRDQQSGHLVGQSWGSRRFYDWTQSGRQVETWSNPQHFLDYQDCEYVAARKTLCSGVAGLPGGPTSTSGYDLGGLAMIDLADNHRILHEVPVQEWSTAGHVITHNPTDLDADGSHLTLYAAPDDGDDAAGTQVLVYETDAAPTE
jgi:hypothetical protein